MNKSFSRLMCFGRSNKTSMKQISELHGVILPEKVQTYTLASIGGCIISTDASEAVSDQHHSNVKFEHEQKL